MTRDRPKPFLAAYPDSGYVFGTSSYTCCRNCGRRDCCPAEKRGRKCPDTGEACMSCTRWSRRGCRYFVLDWSVLKV